MAAIAVPIVTSLISALLPKLLDSFSGGGNRTPGGGLMSQIPNLDPLAMQQYQQYARRGPPDITQSPLFQQAGNYYQNILGQQYDPRQQEGLFQSGVVDPALRMYQQQILPQIHSRFTTPSGTYGSALDQALHSSAQDLTRNLSSLRSDWMQRGQENLANQKQIAAAQSLNMSQVPYNMQNQYYSNLFSQRPTETLIEDPQTGGMDLLKGILSNIPQLISSVPTWSSSPSQPMQNRGVLDYLGGSTASSYRPYQPGGILESLPQAPRY